MTHDTAQLAADLRAEFGQPSPMLDAVAEMDPAIARAYIGLSRATRVRGSLTPIERALISMAVSASVCDLKPDHTRLAMAEALAKGASREMICEVLELASVLGIHAFIPGVQILIERAGGFAAFKAAQSPERIAAAEAAAAKFAAARGMISEIWMANCLVSPDFVSAYADYSSVPWKTTHLPGKIKEFVYVAIDLAPTHRDIGGATFHMEKARRDFGATEDEILEVIEIVGLVGFQTNMMALPILREELARLAV